MREISLRSSHWKLGATRVRLISWAFPDSKTYPRKWRLAVCRISLTLLWCFWVVLFPPAFRSLPASPLCRHLTLQALTPLCRALLHIPGPLVGASLWARVFGLLLSIFFFCSEQFSQCKLHPQLLFSSYSRESHSKKLFGWEQLGAEPGGLASASLSTSCSMCPGAAGQRAALCWGRQPWACLQCPSLQTLHSDYLCEQETAYGNCPGLGGKKN